MADQLPPSDDWLSNWSAALWRGFALRCPRCGKGSMSAGLLKPRPFCTECYLNFSLKEGEFTGGVYINYIVTGLIFILGFVATEVFGHLDTMVELGIWGAFGVLFPFVFQRHAIGLFTAILYLTGALENGPDQA